MELVLEKKKTNIIGSRKIAGKLGFVYFQTLFLVLVVLHFYLKVLLVLKLKTKNTGNYEKLRKIILFSFN